MEEQNEISIGQIFHVIKKSLKFGLLYVLASVVIVVALLLTVRTFTEEKAYSSTLSIGAADVGTIAELNYNKTDAVKKAVAKKGLDSSIVDDIISSITITPIVPEDLDKETAYIPTTFRFTLLPSSNLELNKNEYNEILSMVVNEYIDIYGSSDLDFSSVNYDITEELKHIEYLQVSEDLLDRVTSVKNKINSASEKLLGYKDSNGKGVSDYINDLNEISASIKKTQYYIVANNVQSINSLKDYITWSKKQYEIQSETLESELEEAKWIVENFDAVYNVKTTSTDGSIYVVDTTAYITASNKILSLSSSLSNAKQKIETYNEYLNLIPEGVASAASKSYVDSKLGTALNGINNAVSQFNSLVSQFNANKFNVSKAKVLNPSHETIANPITKTVVILLAVVTAIIAYIPAFVKSFNSLKKSGYFSEEKKEEKVA